MNHFSSHHKSNKFSILMIYSNPWWKVILHKEPRNKCVFLNTHGEYNSTSEYGSVLDAQGVMRNAPTTPSMLVQYSKRAIITQWIKAI